jgi:hypothetical protein
VSSPLDRLTDLAGALRKEPYDSEEFAGLIRSAQLRLDDARKKTNSVESRFDLAYNASHAYCLAALRYRGYRSTNRYVVFQTLPHTLGLGPEVWRVLAKAHELRNRGEYEGDLDVDERITSDLIAACEAVAAAIGKLKRATE